MEKARPVPVNGTNGKPATCLSARGVFRFCAERISQAVGSPWAFLSAFLVVVGWVITGPIFRYSDTWQLVINTATTIITFLMVFLIQNTQNRDTKAVHLKLDELIRVMRGARNSLVSLEHLSDEELDQLQQEFERLRSRVSERSKGETK
jgi:low affinity Fe/Cu permease